MESENKPNYSDASKYVDGESNPATPLDVLRTLQTLFGAGTITFEEYLARKKDLLERN